MTEYTMFTKEEFEGFLESNFPGLWSTADTPYSKEHIYSIQTDKDDITIRIFSSVDVRTNHSRDIGKDAIRCILWNDIENRPIGKTTRVNRVGVVWERILSRISVLRKRAIKTQVVDYEYIKALLSSPSNNGSTFVTSLRDQLEKKHFLSPAQLNCIIGKGTGRTTIEQQVLRKDPNFQKRYISQEDESIEKEVEKEEKLVVRTKELVDNSLLVEDTQNEDNIELISTDGYPYPYDTFNKLQSRIFPYIKEDCNVVVAGNTSSGKTICAELLMFATLAKGRKVIYLSPLKALTQEKYEDWQKTFSGYKIVIMTGDYQMTAALQKRVAAADIILMTSEMLDSRTRMIEAEKNFWFYEVGLLVVDEVHILGQAGDRGHPMEVGIMRFTKVNPTCRVVFLSATMPNVNELGLWLAILNEKKTVSITSHWRPVELTKHYITYEEVRFGSGFMNYKATQSRKISAAVRVIASKKDQKFLVFCHDKNAGRLLMNTFSKLHKEDIRFHNADLNLNERQEIENAFIHGTLRVLVSTPTLSWGRNVPARNVISVGVHRGLSEIDELDLIQMAGRAGRPQYDKEGDVYFLVPKQEESKWKTLIENPKDITSGLKRIDALAFHILGGVHVGDIYQANDAFVWYERSLAHLQNAEFTKDDLEEVLNTLLEYKMLTRSEDNKLILTGLGKVSVFFYFSPFDVYHWFKNFDDLIRIDPNLLEDDYTVSWAMSAIPSNDPGFSRKNIVEDYLTSWTAILRGRGVNLSKTGVPLVNVLPNVIAFYDCLSGNEGQRDPLIGAISRSIKQDIGRSSNAISLIDSMYARWSRRNLTVSNLFDVLELRTKYGVGYELLDLVRIPNIGARRAAKLYNEGYKTSEDLKKATEEDLASILGERTALRIKRFFRKENQT